MGRDFALSNKHPSVIINGTKYHYGHHPDPEYDYYLVESAHYPKDYRWFREKTDLLAFLINLPESAERERLKRLHPDWHEVTDEQRTAYMEQDKARLRAMAEEKVRNGNAQTFNMDLDGEHGPYLPQRIESRSGESPLARVERQIAEYKAVEATNAKRAGYPIAAGEWPRGYTEALKLRVLEAEFDWTGISDEAKEAILGREVDFTKITRDQLHFVYEDIACDKIEPPDATVARRLFEEVHSEARAAPSPSEIIRDDERAGTEREPASEKERGR
jgi:hypothetical protein